MTNININCGNSSKREFLKDFNIALANGNADFIIEYLSDDIIWTMHDNKKIEGQKAFSKEILKMKEYEADEITLHTINSHGKEGFTNGEINMDGKT